MQHEPAAEADRPKFYSEIRTKRLEIRENIIVLFNIAYITIAFTDTEISKI